MWWASLRAGTMIPTEGDSSPPVGQSPATVSQQPSCRAPQGQHDDGEIEAGKGDRPHRSARLLKAILSSMVEAMTLFRPGLRALRGFVATTEAGVHRRDRYISQSRHASCAHRVLSIEINGLAHICASCAVP